jgi:hypothetical protein
MRQTIGKVLRDKVARTGCTGAVPLSGDGIQTSQGQDHTTDDVLQQFWLHPPFEGVCLFHSHLSPELMVSLTQARHVHCIPVSHVDLRDTLSLLGNLFAMQSHPGLTSY